jgi:hypothetical protein
MDRKIICLTLILAIIMNWVSGQDIRNLFFEYKQDSVQDRSANISVPMQGQTFGISGNFITDYVGRTQLAFLTSLIASKNDTVLAMHSLFNGFGNLTGDIETPLTFVKLRKLKQDFAGLSLNTRVSALVNQQGNIQESTGLIDMGLNCILKVNGDLENINAKVIFRNALVFGNFKFLENAENPNLKPSKWLFYNQIQLKINALGNAFIINMPLTLKSLTRKSNLPVPLYAGVGFNF